MTHRLIITAAAAAATLALGASDLRAADERDVSKDRAEQAFRAEAFDKRDDNKDGELTLAEFNSRAQKGEVDERTEMFRRADLNRDGRVTRAEVKEALNHWGKTTARQPERTRYASTVDLDRAEKTLRDEAFDKRDGNEDGRLTLKEFNQDADKDAVEERTEIFYRADLDGDGRVTKRERNAALRDWDETTYRDYRRSEPDRRFHRSRPSGALTAEQERELDALEREFARDSAQIDREHAREMEAAARDADTYRQKRTELESQRREKLDRLEARYDDQRAKILGHGSADDRSEPKEGRGGYDRGKDKDKDRDEGRYNRERIKDAE